MSKKYLVSFGDGESVRLEIIARTRGISIPSLIKEYCMFGCISLDWKKMIDTTLSTGNISIKKCIYSDRIEYELLKIPEGFITGYISNPKIEFPEREKSPYWIISKKSPSGSYIEPIWNEQDYQIPKQVISGEIICIEFQKNDEVDIRKEQFIFRLNFMYQPIELGMLL